MWQASAQSDPQSTFGRELKISADVSSPCQNSAAMEVGVFPTYLSAIAGVARRLALLLTWENDLYIICQSRHPDGR
jgi:hypothetical protein